jgi:hypothetical protein
MEAGGLARRESSGSMRLRKVVATVMSVNAAYNEEQKLQEFRETIRLAVGDATRRFFPQQSDGGDGRDLVADTEHFTDVIAEHFFEMVKPELKVLSQCKGSISKLESELDFLSEQMRRRDELSKAQREELLRELQASNEHVRQLTMMYNDLVESTKRTKRSAPATSGHHGSGGRTPRPVLGDVASPVSAPTHAMEDEEGALEHVGGAPVQPSSPTTTAPAGGVAYLAQLVSTTVIAKQMEAAMEDIDCSTKLLRREEELRAEFDVRNRATMKQLRQEHTVNLQKHARKHEETLRAETHKLETKVKQLESQLRKRELENEQVLRTERERWKSQMQRVVDGSEGKLRLVTVNLRRQCELYQMYHHDVVGQSRIEFDELQEELVKAEKTIQTMENEIRSVKSELQEKDLQLSTISIGLAGGGFRDDVDTSFTTSAKMHNSGILQHGSHGQLSATEKLLAQSGVEIASPSTGPRKERSPPNRRFSKAFNGNEPQLLGDGGGGNQSKARNKSATLASLRQACDSAVTEAAALREQLEKAECELAVTRIARDEAVEERKAAQAMLAKERRASQVLAGSGGFLASFTEPSESTFEARRERTPLKNQRTTSTISGKRGGGESAGRNSKIRGSPQSPRTPGGTSFYNQDTRTASSKHLVPSRSTVNQSNRDGAAATSGLHLRGGGTAAAAAAGEEDVFPMPNFVDTSSKPKQLEASALLDPFFVSVSSQPNQSAGNSSSDRPKQGNRPSQAVVTVPASASTSCNPQLAAAAAIIATVVHSSTQTEIESFEKCEQLPSGNYSPPNPIAGCGEAPCALLPHPTSPRPPFPGSATIINLSLEAGVGALGAPQIVSTSPKGSVSLPSSQSTAAGRSGVSPGRQQCAGDALSTHLQHTPKRPQSASAATTTKKPPAESPVRVTTTLLSPALTAFPRLTTLEVHDALHQPHVTPVSLMLAARSQNRSHSSAGPYNPSNTARPFSSRMNEAHLSDGALIITHLEPQAPAA